MPDEHLTFPPIAITAENLAANRGGRPVFAAVSFAVRGEEALAVRGPNGSGKSTLLRLIAGLLTPAAGHLKITPQNGDRGGQGMHYLGHLDALKPGLTLAENLAFWARLWGSEAEVIEDALDAVGLASLAGLSAAVLSAGQRRRAALARLRLAPRPIWLLDEPTASLDAASEAILGDLISAHLADGGLAVIATHGELPVPAIRTLTLGAA
jgi:heme exporter protein A